MASLLSNDIKVEESFATLKVDLPILCKYPPFKGREDNPWFSGTVLSIDDDNTTCQVLFEDGDVAKGVKVEELFASSGNIPSNVGKGVHRFNDIEPLLSSYNYEFQLQRVEPRSENAQSKDQVSDGDFSIVTEAIFRTINTEENGLLDGYDLDRGLELLGLDKSDDSVRARYVCDEYLGLSGFQELCSLQRDAGAFDILATVCSLQCEGNGIALFDWENGELNEGFAYIDSDKSGTVNGPVEMEKLLYYAGIGKDGSTTMADAIVSYFDYDGDGALEIEEVRAMLRSVKGIAIILYLELWRSTDFSSGSISMEEAPEKAQELQEAYEAREMPGIEFFPHLLASVNVEDGNAQQLSVGEFVALLKGTPNKKMQALRDTQLCQGAPWSSSGPTEAEVVSTVDDNEAIDALRIPQALPGHKIANLNELDWRDVRDNFSEYFYGIKLYWDRDLEDTAETLTFGRACQDDADYLPVAVIAVTKCLLALPPSFLSRREALKSIFLTEDLAHGSPEHKIAGLSGGNTIWLCASGRNLYCTFFHELYHCIDCNDDTVNPDPEDRNWRALNSTTFKYFAEVTPMKESNSVDPRRANMARGHRKALLLPTARPTHEKTRPPCSSCG